MNNNDKLEIVMEEAVSKGYKSFDEFKQWNTFDKDLKNKILRELKIINSEEELDYWAGNYIVEFKNDEPVTTARVSRLFNLSLATAEIIKERIIEKEDDESFNPKNEIAKKWLRNQVYLIDKYSQIEYERKELIKKEAENICAHGMAETIMLAKSISSLLKMRGYFYYNRSSMVASLLQYELGIHDVDCYKFDIDYHICYGENFNKPYSLIFMVSQKHQSKIMELVEKECFKDYEVLKLVHLKENGDADCLYPCNYLIPIKNYDKNMIKELTDYKDKKWKYIPFNYWKENKDKFIRVCIYGSFDCNFIESMNKIDGIRNIDKYDVSELNIALRKGIKIFFDCEDTNHIALINNKDKPLSYEDFLKWLVDNHLKSDEISLGEIRALQIEWLNNLIIRAHYFIKYPEESYKLYFKDFYQAKTKGHILVSINDYEKNRMSPQIKNYHFDIVDRYVGIFFVIDDKLVFYKEKLKYEDTDFIDVEMSHYAFFNTLSTSFDNEYSMFPRGRIVYINKEQCFLVYADRTILKNKVIFNNIKKEFNLPNFNIEYKSDEHYKTLNY